MFTQRKTDSYGLIGTNARNSDMSVESNRVNKYGSRLLNTLTFEQFDATFSQHLDQVFNCPKLGVRQSSLSSDPVDNFLQSSQKNRSSLVSESNVFEMFNNEDQYNPFDCNSKVNTCYSMEQEDSTHDSQTTNSSDKHKKFNLSSNNSDVEEITNDPQMEKLMQDLDFIDQPLAPKRPRKLKTFDNTTSSLCITTQQSLATNCSIESLEEQRRRKNKDQVKVLQAEYTKNPNWTRAYMKELAKKVGLKTSQVYKWNWDQKKKEQDSQKLKKFFYPNEIFQVVDNNGNNITKKVIQRFIINKENHSLNE